MTRVAWLTDLHLNFLPAAEVQSFLAVVAREAPDAVLIGGDIAESHDLLTYLEQIDSRLGLPVYFVLGNHDYYHGSIRQVQADVADFCSSHPRMTWLTECDVVRLSTDVGLVGHDGWADARLGDYERSFVMMNDYRLISELAGLSKAQRWPLLQELGDRAAAHFRRVLPLALETYSHVLALTHVPPFREACWYNGSISNDEWLPHFTCLAAGEALLEIMQAYPYRKLTVLCGHTHGWGEASPAENIRVLTGGAEYGHPVIQQLFELD